MDGLDEGFLDKLPFLKNASRAVKKFMQRYEKLEVQIDRIEQQLDQARMQMLKDITMFDGLYEKNLEYFQELQIYIAAGEEKLKELQETTLPQLHAEAAAKGDAMSAQVVRDFEDTVNRFEKKIHDLKLSKTVAIQTAPQIRLIQNNDKMLVDKIQTAILSTHSAVEEPDRHCPGAAPAGECIENAEKCFRRHQYPAHQKRRTAQAEQQQKWQENRSVALWIWRR